LADCPHGAASCPALRVAGFPDRPALAADCDDDFFLRGLETGIRQFYERAAEHHRQNPVLPG
jgi:hypothetical protein